MCTILDFKMSEIEAASTGDNPETKPLEATAPEGADSESTTGAADGADTTSDLQVKHPLQNCWALWYFKNDRSRDWSDNLKLVAKFQFVEDFWA